MWLQGPAVRWMLWTRQRAIFAIFNNRTFKVPQRFYPVQQQMRSDSLYAWLHHGKDRGETNNHFGKYFIDPIVWLGWYYDKTYQIWRGPRYICENIHLFFVEKSNQLPDDTIIKSRGKQTEKQPHSRWVSLPEFLSEVATRPKARYFSQLQASCCSISCWLPQSVKFMIINFKPTSGSEFST